MNTQIVWHNNRRWRFFLIDERVVAAWIEVGAGTPIRQPHWRKVGMTKATIAAANGNGLIVKE